MCVLLLVSDEWFSHMEKDFPNPLSYLSDDSIVSSSTRSICEEEHTEIFTLT